MKKIFLIIAATYFVLLIKIIKPFIIVRLYPLDIGRIGGAVVVYYYMTAKKDEKYYDVFYPTSSTGKVANYTWLDMIGRLVRILDNQELGQYIAKLNRKLPGWQDHVIPIPDPCPIYGEEYKGQQISQDILNFLKEEKCPIY